MSQKSTQIAVGGAAAAVLLGVIVYDQYRFKKLEDRISGLEDELRTIAQYVKILEAKVASDLSTISNGGHGHHRVHAGHPAIQNPPPQNSNVHHPQNPEPEQKRVSNPVRRTPPNSHPNPAQPPAQTGVSRTMRAPGQNVTRQVTPPVERAPEPEPEQEKAEEPQEEGPPSSSRRKPASIPRERTAPRTVSRVNRPRRPPPVEQMEEAPVVQEESAQTDENQNLEPSNGDEQNQPDDKGKEEAEPERVVPSKPRRFLAKTEGDETQNTMVSSTRVRSTMLKTGGPNSNTPELASAKIDPDLMADIMSAPKSSKRKEEDNGIPKVESNNKQRAAKTAALAEEMRKRRAAKDAARASKQE